MYPRNEPFQLKTKLPKMLKEEEDSMVPLQEDSQQDSSTLLVPLRVGDHQNSKVPDQVKQRINNRELRIIWMKKI